MRDLGLEDVSNASVESRDVRGVGTLRSRAKERPMKKLPLYALLLSLGMFALGCESEPEPAPTTPATDTAAPADGAAPAETDAP